MENFSFLSSSVQPYTAETSIQCHLTSNYIITRCTSPYKSRLPLTTRPKVARPACNINQGADRIRALWQGQKVMFNDVLQLKGCVGEYARICSPLWAGMHTIIADYELLWRTRPVKARADVTGSWSARCVQLAVPDSCTHVTALTTSAKESSVFVSVNSKNKWEKRMQREGGSK